jgi:hypothetical protein
MWVEWRLSWGNCCLDWRREGGREDMTVEEEGDRNA